MPGQEHGLSITTQDGVADNSAAIEAVLVNTNQVIILFVFRLLKFAWFLMELLMVFVDNNIPTFKIQLPQCLNSIKLLPIPTLSSLVITITNGLFVIDPW